MTINRSIPHEFDAAHLAGVQKAIEEVFPKLGKDPLGNVVSLVEQYLDSSMLLMLWKLASESLRKMVLL